MILDSKTQLLQQYTKPIIWNLSCFGNEYQMYILDKILKIFKEYNIENPITTIHGSYSCKYNGGRDAIFKNTKTNIENKIRHFNDLGIGIKLTFSNRFVTSETFEEDEMRWYLDLLNEHKGIGNGIICVNDDFAELVKKYYPDLELVASHVKMELETKIGKTDTPEYYNSKFDLYDIVVFNTFRAFDDDFLSKITHPEKVEFIVNHACTTNCTMAKRHHELIDDLQHIKVKYNHDLKKIRMDQEYIKTKNEMGNILNKCYDIKKSNEYNRLCKQTINHEEINHLLNEFNINRLKIEGRDLSGYEYILSIQRYITNNESIFNLIFTNIMNTERNKPDMFSSKLVTI